MGAGTPTFVNFSRTKGTISQTLARLEEYVYGPWGCHLDGFARMQATDEPYEGGYEMIENQPTSCHELSEVADLINGHEPFGLVYLVAGIPSYFYLHFTEIDDTGHTVTVDMETTMLYHRDDAHPRSYEWLRAWLISLVTAVDADVCEYGNISRWVNWEYIDGDAEARKRYLEREEPEDGYSPDLEEWLRRRLYDALDPQATLNDLRHGRMLECPNPVFHALRTDLISPFEVRRLMNERPKADWLEYSLSPGFHILSNLIYQ